METTGYCTVPPKFARSTRLLYSRYLVKKLLEAPSVIRIPYWGGRISSLNTTGITDESPDPVVASTVFGIYGSRSGNSTPQQMHTSDLALFATPHSRRSLQTPAARSFSKSPVWIYCRLAASRLPHAQVAPRVRRAHLVFAIQTAAVFQAATTQH